MYSEDTRFHCEECEDFDLCENCFFDEDSESTHEHPLVEIKEGKVLFVHHDDKSGNSLILSDFRFVTTSSSIPFSLRHLPFPSSPFLPFLPLSPANIGK